MCGLAGFFGFNNIQIDNVTPIVRNMGAAIAHRGPDSSGIWQDNSSEIALVHQRLSIVDLSPAGYQPMESQSKRFIMVFNGEVYNHLELRSKLQASDVHINWRGHSDTETLLASIETWGLDKTLKMCIGMFAIALWDRYDKTLYLVRDRLGEKPLYYGNLNGVFVFGSELKSLKVHPAFTGRLNRDAIRLQMRHCGIPAPYSVYEDINKLQPGHILKLKRGQEPQIHSYWSLDEVIISGRTNPFVGSEIDAVNKLDQLLSSSVRQQMCADVPLGAFLSGGIDSSTIVALMQAQSNKAVKTFSIGFDEAGFNEAEHAKAVAQHLGTDHHELYVSHKDALDIIPKLSSIYDEPFSDSSQIPTYLVSQMTKEHVTVSLSGDAGDELFGGYNRYFGTDQWWNKINRLPYWVRNLTAKGLNSFNPNFWNNIGSLISIFVSNNARFKNFDHLIPKYANVLSSKNGSDLYRNFVTHWSEPDIILNSRDLRTQLTSSSFKTESMVELMMSLDTVSYLPDDILCKVDRAAMAVSLETRIPMLDHRVLEFAWQLPLSMKIKHGQGKWILRQVLDRYVPKHLIDRPKMGFGVPIGEWLRGPLRDWSESLLQETRINNEGILNNELIQKKWKEHLSGRQNWQYHLWDVLMFQSWLEKENNEKAKGTYFNQHSMECV
ncbi:MAG: asparagine synthase (glutamine-hydrolyzing) [Gammaproteobacteria bacterium]|nr:asparagine synthase (glutamine-hydrolyzing) [Gammaproteobacteria bacterium]